MIYRITVCLVLLLCSYSIQAQIVIESGNAVEETADNDTATSYPIVLRHIKIHGLKKTREGLLYREMSVREGDTLPSAEMQDLVTQNEQRLYNMAIFTDTRIVVDTVSTDTVDWYVVVKERWHILPEVTFKLADRNFNVWWDEMDHDIRRANIGLVLSHKNFRGNMENLALQVQVGYTQRLSLKYMRPYVDKDRRHGLGIQAIAEKNQETWFITDSNKYRFVRNEGSYIIRRYEGALSYIYRPEYASRHLFELWYKDYAVADTIVKLNPEYFENASTQLKMLEFAYRYEYNGVDNWNYSLKGTKAVGTILSRVGIEGMRFQQIFQLEASHFFNPVPKFYPYIVFRGRVTFPEDQPYALRYAMGNNSEYVRGYEYYVIDGSHYGLVRLNARYELLNIQIRNIPIGVLPVLPVRLYPKIFFDAGAVHNRYPANSFLNNRPLYGWGVGLDIVSAYDMKLRVEYSWNHLGEKGLFLHISSE